MGGPVAMGWRLRILEWVGVREIIFMKMVVRLPFIRNILQIVI